MKNVIIRLPITTRVKKEKHRIGKKRGAFHVIMENADKGYDITMEAKAIPDAIT